MLKRHIPLYLLVIIWTLTACASGNTTPTTTLPADDNEGGVTILDAAPTAAAVIEAPTPAPAILGEIGDPIPGCTLASSLVRPADPTEASLFKPVTDADWVDGPEDAATTIIEYADFQCPDCARLAPVLAQLKADFPDDVRVVFRQYPQITVYDKSALAAVAAEAAGQQDMFWEMHDLLYQTQPEWVSLTPEDFGEWLVGKAETLGMDPEQFRTDLGSQALSDKVQADYDEASEIPVPGTPFFVVNDRIYDGPTDYNSLSLLARIFGLEKIQYSTCPSVVIDPNRTYIATILTEYGEIVIELLPQFAPIAVNNFVFLAREGWYDGVRFHRVLPNFMAQSGDPSSTGFGGPGYAFVNETSPDLLFDAAGLLAMANSGPDTNGSQFFITIAPYPSLNGGYTIFGRVISGMDVVNLIQLRDPSQSLNLPPGDEIISVTIEEN